jgi:hypothetical protein
MTDQNERDPREAQPQEGYEAPRIEALGAVDELTQGTQSSIER